MIAAIFFAVWALNTTLAYDAFSTSQKVEGYVCAVTAAVCGLAAIAQLA